MPGHNRGRRVLVAGGGIAGMAAALAFARTGARVSVFEQAPALTEIGAGLQITPNGFAVLRGLGLGAEARARGLQAQALVPKDGLTGRALARFDLSSRDYRFFHRADLLGMLADAARAAGVAVQTGAHVTASASRSLTVRAEVVAGDLVIGADGLHSVLRPALNGADKPFFTGQVAWRAVIAQDVPPEARIWMLPGRHVVTYPLPGGRLNIVAVREQVEWVPEGWAIPDTPANLQAAFAGASPELRAILARVEEVRLWGLFRHPVAKVWQDGTRAILGDAAHPTLPFLAQGANLALEDALSLAWFCDRSPELAAGLAGWQSARRPRAERAILEANGNAVNYHLSGARRAAAHAGLRVIGRVAPDLFLRRFDWLYGHDAGAG